MTCHFIVYIAAHYSHASQEVRLALTIVQHTKYVWLTCGAQNMIGMQHTKSDLNAVNSMTHTSID